jgi:hypothetical protein
VKFTEEELKKIKKEQMEQIDRYLDNEYGTSYTRLRELHDYFFEKYTDQKEEIERLNKELEFERQTKKEAIEYIKSIPDDEFVESEHFTELLFIFGKVGSDKE